MGVCTNKGGRNDISDSINDNTAVTLKNYETFFEVTGLADKNAFRFSQESTKLRIEFQEGFQQRNPNANTSAFVLANLALRYFDFVNLTGYTEYLKDPTVGKYLQDLAQKKSFEDDPNVVVVFGDAKVEHSSVKYATSSGWSLYISNSTPCDWQEIAYNPLTAAFTGCLIFGELYKESLSESFQGAYVQDEFIFDFISSGTQTQPVVQPPCPDTLDIDLVIAGCGGVGQSIAYLLNLFELYGRIHFVDPDVNDASNDQRYLLSTPQTIGMPKALFLAEVLKNQQFLEKPYNLHQWGVATTLSPELFRKRDVLVSFDNKRGRLEVQAALPRVIWNSWTATAPGEIRYGFGKHKFDEEYQCLACVYFPKDQAPASQMEFNAKILGLTEDQLEDKISKGTLFTENDLNFVKRHFTIEPNHQEKMKQLIGLPFSEIFHGNCGLLQSRVGEGHETTPAPHTPTSAACVLVIHYILEKLGLGSEELGYSSGEYSGFHYPTKHSRLVTERHPQCICGDEIYQEAYQSKWRGDL